MKKKYIAIIAIGIFLIWAGSAAAIYRWVGDDDRGTFGDMFGAVNALFSGLAFAGLIYTIAVQRQELSLQREAIEMQTEELKMQREETARSADQLEGQKNLLNLQTALSVVNDLIRTKNKRIEEITISAGSGWIKGSQAMKYMSEVGMIGPWSKERKLHTYLNMFYYILTFINEYDLEEEQKKLLRDLLNVDTTDEELKVIYSSIGNDQHKSGLLASSGFLSRYKKLT